MAPVTASRNRNIMDRNSTSPHPNTSTDNRTGTRSTGTSVIIEDLQDIKNPDDGRKYLEKRLLLCPPGEPPTHTSLATCLHQISAMRGIPKPVIDAIRSVAFLLGELEETQINLTVKEALDLQINEFASDIKVLVEDAKEKIDSHIKNSEERLTQLSNSVPSHTKPPTNSYASALINPPPHANPRVAAREGIRARQFAVEGIKNSKFSHLDNSQLKVELNKILIDLGVNAGKIRSITSARNGSVILETDNDEAASWLARAENQAQICDRIDANAEFRTRTYNVIALNVPIALNPDDSNHRQEICEANNVESHIISAAKWAKSVDKRTPNQRTAHLLISFINADAANRAIVNGLYICNRKCHVEKTKKEPIRCLKCQGWNHFAKDCIEGQDKCGNCAESHRTSSCQKNERKCVSCGTNDHASWSRTCPTFLKKRDEFNSRNPDNSLQFFPTADPWSWTPIDRTSPPRAPTQKRPTPQAQTGLSNVQLGKRPQRQHTQPPQRPQQPRKRWDTYIPDYDNNLIDLDLSQHAAPTNLWDNPFSNSLPPTTSSQQASGSGQSTSATATVNANPPPNRSPNPSPLNNA